MAKEPRAYEGEIAELLNPELLEQHIRNRVVNRRSHPTLPLAILNYGQKAQFENIWDSVTCRTRGLIYDFDSGDLVAVPFAKFFNYNTSWRDETLPQNLPAEEPEITAKLDGSLGILWRFGGRHGIATRGSFDSEQAKWASKWFDANARLAAFPAGWTPLFEIIYPENRVVVRYEFSGLTLIGCVDNQSGAEMSHCELEELGKAAGVPAVERINGKVEELAAKDRDNEEGFVATWHRDDGPPLRVKIKCQTYFRLHKLLTGTSPKRIWEYLRDGLPVSFLTDFAPAHFNEWVTGWEKKLTAEYAALESAATERFASAQHLTADRKQFALWATTPENRHLSTVLFSMLDGKDYKEAIWKKLRPTIEGLGTFKKVDE